jgi:lysophospholipase L1-like esterase
VAVYTVILAVALEVGVRWLLKVPDQIFMTDPLIGVGHIPGKMGRWTSTEFDVPVRINAHGFRDRERTEAKPAGTRRIVILGDSFVEALQVPLEDTFGALLETRLGGGRGPVEVLNLGVSSTGTGQQLLLFRDRGRRYAPDVVVLAFFTGNDFRNNSRALDGDPVLTYPVIGADGRLERDAEGTPRFTAVRSTGALRQFLREHLASYRFFAPRVRSIGPLTAWVPWLFTTGAATATVDPVGDTEVPSRAWRTAVDVTLELLSDLEREVRRAGAALFVVVIPAPWEVSAAGASGPATTTVPGWALERPERVVLETLERRGVPAISVRERLRAETDGGHAVFFAQDGHLNARGHRAVAEVLSAALEERRLVD